MQIPANIRDFFVCILIAVFYIYPILMYMTTHVPTGDGSRDAFQFLWNFWWTKQALLHSQYDLYVTDLLFFPDGTSLLFHTLSAGNAFVSLPIQMISGEISGLIASLNFLTFVHFVLVGYGVCLILRHLRCGSIACYVAATIVMFLPYRMHHLNHINLISHGWLVMCLYFVLLESKEHHWKHCALASLFAILTFYSDHGVALQLLLSGMWLTFLYFRMQQWKSILYMVCGTLLGCVPFFLACMDHPLEEFVVPKEVEAELLSANIFGFFMPSSNGLIAGKFHVDFLDHGVAGNESSLGIAMILGLLFSIHRSVQYRHFLIMGGFFLLLALGPILHMGSHSLDLWMPFDLLQNTSFLSMMRAPVRFISVAGIFLSIAIGLGISKHPKHVQYGLFGLVLLFQIPSQPISMTGIDIPTEVIQLKADQRDYAILYSPVYYRHKQTYMMWQTVHGHPISTGYTARKWRGTGTFFRSIEETSNIQNYFAIENSKQVVKDGFGAWYQYDAQIENIQEKPQIRWFIEGVEDNQNR